MSRLADDPRPDTPFPGLDHVANWERMTQARAELDDRVVTWAGGLAAADLSGDLRLALRPDGRRGRRPRWFAVTHMFNHQTHHRGQVHALLTAFGARPLDTDLILMPPLA